MNAKHKARLLKLAKFLREEVKPEEFDLGYFIYTGPGFKPPADVFHMSHWCGTTACALGWATRIWPKEFWFSTTGDCASFKSKDGLYGEQFFGITDDQWEYLFGCNRVRSPKQEARIIENFVRRIEK